MTATASTPQSSATPSRGPRWFVPLLLLVATAVALGAGVAIGRHAETPALNSTAQLARVQSGCEQWVSLAKADTPEGGWCAQMTSWMGDRISGGMMGSSMWDGPGQLRGSCRQWADENGQAATSSAGSSCDDMVTWMSDHAVNGWDNMMMHDR